MSADEPERPAARTWPAHAAPPPGERVELDCASCAQPWHVHVDLAGFRFQCGCGAWVAVPADPRRPESLGVAALLGAGDPEVAAPAAIEPARESVQRRAVDRSVLGLAAMLAALWLPWLGIELLFTGRAQVLAMPFAGVAGGMAVLAVGLVARRSTFGALAPARTLAFVEATGVALAMAAVALAYGAWLEGLAPGAQDLIAMVKAELGLAGTVFLIGLLPAIFEELAFRGLVQARVTLLFGRTLGILVAGAAFALAHGITPGLPFHLALGLHLGWLRARSSSLYPGMLEHFLYNTALVVMATP